MTSIFKIHDTVIRVSSEAKVLIPKMPIIKNELKLLSSLVLCILSSQEKYEVALSIMKSLRKENILRIPRNKSDLGEMKSQIKNTLKNPVYFRFNEKEYSRRLRFFVKKSEYIINTLENIYLNDLSIHKILNQKKCIQETRKNIIRYCCGLGPKQASMFLRDIGYYSEFAILDKHVMDYMRILGLTCVSENSFSNITAYQRTESQLKSYADTYNIDLLHLDLAIWTTMRSLKNIQG